MNESVEDLAPTTENFEKLKMMYQYSESTRSLFQEEREQALMQLDRIQAERDELGGRVIPRLEAQLASVQEQLDQTQARRDELEKKYTKAKRLIKDLTNESNEMKEHVRTVKEQMSSMKEEFQQENFTLHEKIATLEAQLLQMSSAANTPNAVVAVANTNEASTSGVDSLDSTLSNDASIVLESSLKFEPATSSVQAKGERKGFEVAKMVTSNLILPERHAELLSEARTRSSYVESQFNQVIQLLETPPRRYESRECFYTLTLTSLLSSSYDSWALIVLQNLFFFRRPLFFV